MGGIMNLDFLEHLEDQVKDLVDLIPDKYLGADVALSRQIDEVLHLTEDLKEKAQGDAEMWERLR